ncbi:pyridoxal-phosphate dependent enzyme [Calditrichota bacterium]
MKITDIQTAAERIAPHIHRTPVMTSRSLNEIAGCELYFKCENLQRTGSFKMRGAANAVFSLPEMDADKGVCTHSSGNFAQALSLAAQERGVAAHIVMPRTAPEVKQAAVKAFGGQITLCEPTLTAREETLAQIQSRTGATFIHPYNNEIVIAGQGTAVLELLADKSDLDVVIAPVGGGGLCSGTAIAAKGIKASIEVFGAEPLNANDAYLSLQAGCIMPPHPPNTIADGLLTALGELTFPILRDNLTAIVTVTEEEIRQAMRLLWERLKIVVEPSGAVPLSAALKRNEIPHARIGVILSGGNVDVGKYI